MATESEAMSDEKIAFNGWITEGSRLEDGYERFIGERTNEFIDHRRACAARELEVERLRSRLARVRDLG